MLAVVAGIVCLKCSTRNNVEGCSTGDVEDQYKDVCSVDKRASKTPKCTLRKISYSSDETQNVVER